MKHTISRYCGHQLLTTEQALARFLRYHFLTWGHPQ